MSADLQGQTAIITGASRGIGLAVAQALIGAGANVVLTSRKPGVAEEVAATLGEAALGIQAHAADEEAAAACVDETLRRFGSIDILVNNAGTNPAYGPLVEIDRDRFMKTVEVNLWAPLLWTSLVWRAWMRDNGGCIINMASLGGIVTGADIGAYDSAKAGLIHLTNHLAAELAPKVRVNALAPGVVRTRLAEAIWKEQQDAVENATPLGRAGEPADIAPAVVFLAGDGARWITGETMVIDGGQRWHPAPAFGSRSEP